MQQRLASPSDLQPIIASVIVFADSAIGSWATVGLAVVTAALAWVTWRMARSTAADVAAQDRPVLVPGVGGGNPPTPLRTGRQSVATYDTVVWIRNAGQGPAISVEAALNGKPPAPWNRAAISPGAEVQISFFGVLDEGDDNWVLEIAYRDLAERHHFTVIDIESPKPGEFTMPNTTVGAVAEPRRSVVYRIRVAAISLYVAESRRRRYRKVKRNAQ